MHDWWFVIYTSAVCSKSKKGCYDLSSDPPAGLMQLVRQNGLFLVNLDLRELEKKRKIGFFRMKTKRRLKYVRKPLLSHIAFHMYWHTPHLIYDSVHFVIHSPFFPPAPVKKRQTKQTDTGTDKQTNRGPFFHWRWRFCRTGAVVMIDLSGGVRWRFTEKRGAQRRANEFRESVKLPSSCGNTCLRLIQEQQFTPSGAWVLVTLVGTDIWL